MDRWRTDQHGQLGSGRFFPPRGKFMQLAGLRFSWNPLAPLGSKILSAEVMRAVPKPSPAFDASFNLDATPAASAAAMATWRNQTWLPVDADLYYTVAVSSFVAADGDGYTVKNHPVCTVEAINLGTRQIVLLNYLAAYQPLYASVAERRIVREAHRYSSVLLSVAPNTGDITQTNILLLAGHYLYVGPDARNRSVQLRVTLAGMLGEAGGAIHVECHVLPHPSRQRRRGAAWRSSLLCPAAFLTACRSIGARRCKAARNHPVRRPRLFYRHRRCSCGCRGHIASPFPPSWRPRATASCPLLAFARGEGGA